MSSPPDSTLADPQELIADLQRQLAASNAERDEGACRKVFPGTICKGVVLC